MGNRTSNFRAYDYVIEINQLNQCWRDGFPIKVVVPSEDNKKLTYKIVNKTDLEQSQASIWNGVVVGVMGLYNRGKTFVMSNISDVNLEQGYTVHTEGLSRKFSKLSDEDIVVLDTAGKWAPITLENYELEEENPLSNMLLDSSTVEEFLQSLTLSLSNYLIIVVCYLNLRYIFDVMLG